MPIPEGTGPIPRLLTREKVLDTIRDWIINGTLAPGEDLRDGELAETLGVSRSPVRVALVELQREELVDRAPNGRVSVAQLSVEDLERLIPVWQELEVLAARQATEHIARGRSMVEIEAAHAEFAEAAGRPLEHANGVGARPVQVANERFHAAVLAAADNRFLATPLTALRAHNRRYENAYFAHDTGLARLSADDHQEIVSAMRAHDPEAAAAGMRRHIERARELMQRSQQLR